LPPPEQELAGLKNEAEQLKSELEAITRRIDELEQKS
jgi:predicted  nucleic acid-binding Zn-ribbon protein